MGKLIFVLGASGSGKTAVTKKALEEIEQKYEIVNFGDVLQGIIGKDRDKFRRETDYSGFQEIQEKTAHKIAGLAKEKNVIVTSHAEMYRESGYIPGFPRWVLDILKPHLIAFIWSKPENIMKRKQRDDKDGVSKGRTRDKISVEKIANEQDFSKQICFAYSMYSGAGIKFIENREGQIEEAAEELARAINNL